MGHVSKNSWPALCLTTTTTVKQIAADYITPVVGVIEGAAFTGDWVRYTSKENQNSQIQNNTSALYITGEILGSFVLGIGVTFIHWTKAPKNPEPNTQTITPINENYKSLDSL